MITQENQEGTCNNCGNTGVHWYREHSDNWGCSDCPNSICSPADITKYQPKTKWSEYARCPQCRSKQGVACVDRFSNMGKVRVQPHPIRPRIGPEDAPWPEFALPKESILTTNKVRYTAIGVFAALISLLFGATILDAILISAGVIVIVRCVVELLL